MSLKVYKASAGSGKTFQLSLEYIALALESPSPNAFSKILAVTFTNKATAEMKDRILIQLYNLAKGSKDAVFSQMLQKRLNLTKNEVEMRAADTLNAIVHNYDRFRVETIDSFFQWMLTNLAHELKLSRTFRVDLDTNEVVSLAVDRLLLSIKENDSSKAQIANFVLQFMEDKIGNSEGWNIAKELKQFAKANLFGDEYQRCDTALEDFLSEEENLNGLKSELIKREKSILAEIIPLAENLKTLLYDASYLDPTELKAYKSLCELADKLLSGDYGAKTDKVSIEKSKEDPLALLTAALKKKPDYVELAGKVACLLSRIDEKRTEANRLFMQTSFLTKKNLLPLCLLGEIGSEVTRICNENNTFMLAKTPDLFNKVVTKDDSSFVFERMGNTFDHVLIDEFQDTSHIQWDNFRRLLIENLATDKDCMLVGDVKQSIYRWRGGDWTILGFIEKGLPNIKNIDTVSLVNNFRSKQVIVNFNNAFFQSSVNELDKLNKESEYDSSGLVNYIYNDVVQVSNDKSGEGYVRVSLCDKSFSDENLLDDLYEQIQLIHDEKRVPYGKMAILVRYKREAQSIIDYFAKHYPTIPFTSDEAFKLAASPAVMLLVCTMQYLSNPDNTVAFALCWNYGQAISRKCGVDVLNAFSKESLISKRKEWCDMPLYELCYQLIAFYNLSECEVKGAGQSPYLFSFLDQVLAFLENKPSDVKSFLQHWDDSLSVKSINVDIEDSIYIMTIHKSKGLERHTVFIPFCNWNLEKDFKNDILWCSTQNIPSPFNKIPLVPVNSVQSQKVKDSYFAENYYKEHLMQRIDNLNSLYVAFTRARNNLLVWSKPSTTNNSVHLLIKKFIQDGGNFGIKETETGKEGFEICESGVLMPYVPHKSNETDNPLIIDNSEKTDVSLFEYPLKVAFKQSNKAKDFLRDFNEDLSEVEKDSINARFGFIDKGKLMHYLLSKVETASDVERAIQCLQREGLVSEPKEIEAIKHLITKRLQDEHVAKWFDGTWQVFAECSILERDSTGSLVTNRPDRVMRKGDDIVVVDYKFGNFKDEYVAQVQGYMQTLIKMGYKSVSGYLWFVYTGDLRPVTI